MRFAPAGCLVLTLLLLPAAASLGATWYVDFAGGADPSAGDSPTTAFQHCPGDPEAKDKSAAVKLAAGDRVLFKGGVVYRGAIVAQQSGEEGKPIVYDGNSGQFGAGRAILDGSEPLTGWKKCASADECGGNPNWASIWSVEVPFAFTSPDQANLFEDDKPLAVAQDPRPDNPWWPHPVQGYYRYEPNQATSTSFRDDARFTQSSPRAWDGAYLTCFVGGAGWYYSQKVSGFEPNTHTITFPGFRDIPNMRLYNVMNAVPVLNHSGQYVVRSEGGKSRLFLWPLRKDGGPAGVTVTRRPFGVNLNGQSHVTLQGFVVQRLVAAHDQTAAPILDGGNKPSGGVVIRDNEVKDCCRDRLAASKIGVVCVSNQKGTLVERNELHDNRGCGGVLVDAGQGGQPAAGHVVRENVVYRNGGIGVRLWLNVKDCRIERNVIRDTMTDAVSPHAPVGILVWTGCTGTVIHGNLVYNNGQSPLYLSGSSDVTVACNLFVHKGREIINGQGGKDIRLLHNVFLSEEANSAAPMRLGAWKDAVAKNNVLVANGNKVDAATGYRIDESHNLYTDLAHLKDLFADPSKRDFRPRKGSPVIGAGVATDLREDAAGTPFPKDRPPDIGAFVYTETPTGRRRS